MNAKGPPAAFILLFRLDIVLERLHFNLAVRVRLDLAQPSPFDLFFFSLNFQQPV